MWFTLAGKNVKISCVKVRKLFFAKWYQTYNRSLACGAGLGSRYLFHSDVTQVTQQRWPRGRCSPSPMRFDWKQTTINDVSIQDMNRLWTCTCCFIALSVSVCMHTTKRHFDVPLFATFVFWVSRNVHYWDLFTITRLYLHIFNRNYVQFFASNQSWV